MENKKTKLTISGNPKKTLRNFDTTKSQVKKTVKINNQINKPANKSNFNKSSSLKSQAFNNKKSSQFKGNFSKASLLTSDFEKRKLAEQRATKRLKGETDNKEKKTKLSTKKREVKLTVSRALSDEIETRERSLASVKRARQKELKNANKNANR